MARGGSRQPFRGSAIGSLALAFLWTAAAESPRQLAPGQPVKGEFPALQVFTAQVDAGQLLNIELRKRAAEMLVSLIDPAGRTLITADMPGDPAGRLKVSWIATEAGAYSIRLDQPGKPTKPTAFEIELGASQPPSEADRIRIAAQAKLYAGASRDRAGNREGRAAAILLYGESLPLWHSNGDTNEETYCHQRIGYLHSEAGEQPKAIESLEKALALRRANRDRAGEAYAMSILALAYTRAGDQPKALENYLAELEIRRALADRPGQSLALNNIAYVHYVLGEPQKTLARYQEVLDLGRSTGDKTTEVAALNNLARAYNSMGEPQKSLDTYQQVLAMRRAMGDRVGEARTLSVLGSVYRDLGAEQKALEYYQLSIATGRAAGDTGSEADTETGIGDVYFFLGDKQKSIGAYERAVTLKRAAKDRSGEALALIGIGNVYSDLASRQKPSESMGLPGKKKGLEYYEQSLAIGRTSNDYIVQVFALMGAGVVYSDLGDKKKAMDYLNQALFLFSFVRWRPGEGWAKYEMARVERDRGNLDKALTLAGNARDIIESLRSKVISQDLRASFFAAVHDCYGLEVDILMRLHAADPSKNHQAEALTASERARARVLLETLGESRVDIREGVDPKLLDLERDLQLHLNAKEMARIQMMGAKTTPEVVKKMQAEVKDLAAQYEDVNTKIRAVSPHYAALKFPQPLSLAEIQKQVLDADTLLLEYALGDQRSFLWVVSPDSISSFILPKKSEVEEAARRFHATLQDPGTRGGAEAGKALSKMLLGEAGAVLGKKRLMLVADGALQYLPFAALPDPAEGQQPLVVNHEIVNVPSASTLAVLRRENQNRKPAAKMLAILADPVFSADDPRIARFQAQQPSQPLDRAADELGLAGVRLTRLPGTRREAAGIAALVPASERKQALDFDASRATLTNPDISQYRILHIASHGLLNTTHPELSGVVLSLVDGKGQPQDGFLRLHEIYNLKLSADLVVLSACQTGLGKEIQGEGLVGLTRGFMYAGAPRVLASLWKVDDRATAELMKRLYTAMLSGPKLSPAAALRAAQIEMSKNQDFRNPYYWAAFTLQGEWR